MLFDSVVTNPGRLRILAALACEPVQEFVRLRSATRLTDGNLATHARRLQSAGLVTIDKSLREGRPVTTFHLTAHGREALQAHARQILEALDISPAGDSQPAKSDVVSEVAPAISTLAASDDDWVD